MVDNEKEKEPSLEMGCVKSWCSLLKEEGGDTQGGDTWSNATLEEQGVAAHSKGFGRVV